MPVVSIRVSVDQKKELDEFKDKSGFSNAYILEAGLNNTKPDFDAAYAVGYEKGYESAHYEFVVYYFCPCGDQLMIDTDEEKAAVFELMAEAGWGEIDCIDSGLY
jgi:hypothetical protein